MKSAKKLILLSIIALITLVSFQATTPTSDANIQGIWINTGYEDGASIYTKKNSFDPDQPGIQFKENGSLIKRQNIGWCGTPPISYGNYKGHWGEINDSTIRIEYEYWGGLDTAFIKIVSLDDTTLKTKWSYNK